MSLRQRLLKDSWRRPAKFLQKSLSISSGHPIPRRTLPNTMYTAGKKVGRQCVSVLSRALCCHFKTKTSRPRTDISIAFPRSTSMETKVPSRRKKVQGCARALSSALGPGRRLNLGWAALLFGAALAWSQPGSHAVEGTVRDPSGALLPGARVIVESKTYKHSATTSAKGNFSFQGVPEEPITLT